MHIPDTLEKKLNPVCEWNSSNIVFTPESVEHWLNGRKILSFVPAILSSPIEFSY